MIKEIIFLVLILIQIINCELIYSGQDASFNPDWWQKEIIYQIYVRSFKDSDGDGIGDLRGITEQVEHFSNIGVSAIWLTPIYQTPGVDFGYDISDFERIDETFGTMSDFDNLVVTYHRYGIKIILDFVPNHTSDKHVWFKKSVQRIAPYTDYYIWHDGIKNSEGKRMPPNNWLSVFNSGSAWKWNEQRNQYYLHQFLEEQPDLNFRNPNVVHEIRKALYFWLERGVDGFRLDSANFLFESKDLSNEPKAENNTNMKDTDYYSLNHTYTIDQPETYELHHTWRELLDEYKEKDGSTRLLVVECYSPFNQTMKYYGNSTVPGAHFPFNFMLIINFNRQSNANQLQTLVTKWIKNMPKGMWPNWVLGNHDNSRIASRFDPMLVDGLHMFQMLLPGTPVTYYGDELGIRDTFVRWDQTIDKGALNVGPERYEKFTRDPVRAPFPWNYSIHGGFSYGEKTWLPVSPDYWKDNVQSEEKYKSHLKTYKQLTDLRKKPTFTHGNLHVYTISDWVFGFSRSYTDHPTYVVLINLGSEMEIINLRHIRRSLPEILMVKVSSINSGFVTGNLVSREYITLRPKAALTLTTS
ncbi:maltase 2-like isoform X6 [Daktulosphaira vitifoliae]|uniref:maltase 2-like isoform X2 n=1 Tax=Daktulosphaira vitifoliae TaxID=58002 RepID=UPI0021A992F4|nr:maltase 2-like isoform X2 [Daktulosphaira vitifoliae]XP_050543465.1 maltase 2-like isoform X3 [Daktulosphaira vitifoliae]XP_050543466.1 maltase 2-like isoform X4 [Daktulosphaira vitifoliae]XP_050543467.1 maltase 2-like isoform X5 [Daktulosphaira vitifoliae]XP_050543468.1 maltase 2-like isoform X6 [Daktulosphaira vitifoliae]